MKAFPATSPTTWRWKPALEGGRLRTVLADAVWAAYRRTMSLSESLSAGREPDPMPPA